MKGGAVAEAGGDESVLGSLTVSCSSQGDGSMRCTRRFTGAARPLARPEQDNIRQMFGSIVEADRTMVSFQEGS